MYYILYMVVWGFSTFLLATIPASVIYQILLHIVGHETNVLDTIWIVLFFVGVCVGGYIIGKMIWNSIQTHNKEAAVARDRWKHSYICMRCGARFIIR